MKRLGLILFLLIFGVVLAACNGAPAEPIEVETEENVSITYEVTDQTDAVVAEITWDGENWTCNIQNCAQNYQISGNLMRFFVGTTLIATENQEVSGQLVPETGFKVWFVEK